MSFSVWPPRGPTSAWWRTRSLRRLEKAVKIVVDGLGSEDHRVRDVAMRAFADPDLPSELLRPGVSAESCRVSKILTS